MHDARRHPLRLLGLYAMLAGCTVASVAPESGGAAATARVTGTVAYRERIALPPTAVITVQLVDVSRADAPATVIARQALPTAGRQVPFSFSLEYDPATIQTPHTYAVQVRIEDDGKLLFISDTLHAVITRGGPTHVDIIVRKV
jgi:putative lipoprotein